MGAVRSAEGVCRHAPQLVVDMPEIAVGKHHVAVEYDEILSPRALRPVVAALSRTRVLLHVVVQVELSGVSCAHLFAVAH